MEGIADLQAAEFEPSHPAIIKLLSHQQDVTLETEDIVRGQDSNMSSMYPQNPPLHDAGHGGVLWQAIAFLLAAKSTDTTYNSLFCSENDTQCLHSFVANF